MLSIGMAICFISFKYFLSFAGVERINWDGNKITSTEIINEHDGSCYNPIVFEMTDPDECKNFCSDDFCYV